MKRNGNRTDHYSCESTEPSHSPNRNDIDEDTEEIPPEALASVFENKAKESAMFDNTSGLGDTIPSPPNRTTKSLQKASCIRETASCPSSISFDDLPHCPLLRGLQKCKK